MVMFPALPDGASSIEREAHAMFIIMYHVLPVVRAGGTITDEGWNAIIETAERIVGTDALGAPVRDLLSHMRTNR